MSSPPLIVNYDLFSPNFIHHEEIDGELYVRYNQDKALEWLETKRTKIIEILRQEMEPTASMATLRSYANDLLADYLPEELCDTLKSAAFKESADISDIATKASSDILRKPSTAASKKRSSSKEPVKHDAKSSNKLTKWFSPVPRS